MTEITLDLVSMDSTPLPTPRSCRFEGLGGTIGRDEGNTLVLQDKHRRVSRLHASVTFPDGVATIANASTTLPISVGTKVLAGGHKAVLAEGDQIEIGPFVLKVRAAKMDAAENSLEVHNQPTILATPGIPLLPHRVGTALMPTPQGRSTSTLTPGEEVDPFADLFADLSSADNMIGGLPLQAKLPEPRPVPVAPSPLPVDEDPFADLLGPPSGPPTTSNLDGGVDPFAPFAKRIEPSMSMPSHLETLPERPSISIIPEDFNPFELPSQTSRNSADPLGQMLGEGSPQTKATISASDPSIDALFAPNSDSALGAMTNQASLSDFFPAPALDVLSLPAESSDPMLMFGVAPSGSNNPIRSPVRDDLPELGGAYQAPRAMFANASMNVTQNQGSIAGRSGDASPNTGVASTDALTVGFLKGAGLPVSALPGGLTPEMMTVIGGLLKTAISGAIDMLAARAATKLEVLASVTIISSQSNNPLKFLPNAETALQQMLGKKMPGFMRADDAMRDAFDDLRAHEIGVIAGTRAALTEVLGRFDPSFLEKRLTRGSLFESLLPSIRKTKLWEIYLEQYAKIRREAEDDFQSIFGRSFLEAYERETARVKAHTTESGKK